MVFLQSNMDRFVWNLLLQLLKSDYAKQGGANCSRNRIYKWYTELRNRCGTRFLHGQVSHITHIILYELAYDKMPDIIFGEPKFRHRCSWKVSLPLVFTRDNTVGPAKFVSDRDIRISKFGNRVSAVQFRMDTNYAQLVSYMIRTEDGDLSYHAKSETIRHPLKYHTVYWA